MGYLGDVDFLLLVLIGVALGYVFGRILWKVFTAIATGLFLVILAIVTTFILAWQAMVETVHEWGQKLRRRFS